MPYAVTDPTCGHTITTTVIPEHAHEQARLADTAGYPTHVEEWESLDDQDTAPPSGCDRCWGRIAATLDLIFRNEVAAAALDAGVDPFTAVAKYTRQGRMHPHLDRARLAEIVVHTVIPWRVEMGLLYRYDPPDVVPDGLMDLPRVGP